MVQAGELCSIMDEHKNQASTMQAMFHTKGTCQATMSATTWKQRLASLGCIMCHHFEQAQCGRTMLHHVREGQGMSQRADDYLLIPLCHEHHQGANGWHGLGKSAFYQRYKSDELDLLAWTLRAMDEL